MPNHSTTTNRNVPADGTFSTFMMINNRNMHIPKGTAPDDPDVIRNKSRRKTKANTSL